jgi:predicted HD phosphohydrolase
MTDTTEARPRAAFHAMTEGTKEDWDKIALGAIELAAGLPDRVLVQLRQLGGDYGGFAVDRLEHSLQTATRAYRADRDDEYVFCALIHDIGDLLGPLNHADVAAAVVKPFVSEQNHWMVEKHAIFQGYYFFHHIGLDRNMREQFRGHPCFERTALFCERYDAPAFDPRGETLPLDAFVPMVGRVFAAPKRTLYTNLT